jgi:flagellar protein FliO/FliZ
MNGFGMGSLLQALLGLAVVVGLILACGWAARRFGLQQVGGGRWLKVISSVAVGQRERVVVVEVDGTWLVLGVASGQVRPLHHMPAGQMSTPPAQVNATAKLSELLKNARAVNK